MSYYILNAASVLDQFSPMDESNGSVVTAGDQVMYLL